MDEEELTVTADGNGDQGDEEIIITYQLNGVATALTLDDPAIDVTSATAVADAVATALNGIAGISAVDSGAQVDVTGDGINSVEILAVNVVGDTTTLGVAVAEGTDVAQVSTLTIPGTVNPGEVYSVLVSFANGQMIGAEFEVPMGGTPASVATGLASVFNTVAGAGTVDATAVGADVTFTDENADNGGFLITTDVTTVVSGTGASNLGATVHTTADVITDFLTGTDQIDLNSGADGDGTNYVEAGDAGTYAAALANAATAINGTVQYYFTTATTDVPGEGLLFFDADANGSVDGVVKLTGRGPDL